MTIGEFKAQFSDVVKTVDKNHCIAVTYGKKKEVIGYFVKEPQVLYENRKLGFLQKKASYSIRNDFEMTADELLDL